MSDGCDMLVIQVYSSKGEWCVGWLRYVSYPGIKF